MLVGASDRFDARTPGVVRHRISDRLIGHNKKPRGDDSMLSRTSALAHAEGLSRSLNRRPTIAVVEDDRGVDDMRVHAERYYVRLGCIGQQLHSCVASGKMHIDD